MPEYRITLDRQTAAFFERVAQLSGRAPAQVLADALFRLAGGLSLRALADARAQSES